MRYILTFILLSISTSCYGWGANAPSFAVSQSISAPSSCGTNSVVVSDDFSTDLSGFTQEGVWSVGSGETWQSGASSTARFLRSNTVVNPDCQWAEVIIGLGYTTGGFVDNYIGMSLRMAGSTGYRYVVTARKDSGGTTTDIIWMIYDGTTLIESIGSVIVPSALNTNDKITAQISGTGNAQSLYLWVNGVGSGPSAYGAPDYTLTNVGAANVVDTGSYIGVFSRDWTSSPLNSITIFTGGN